MYNCLYTKSSRKTKSKNEEVSSTSKMKIIMLLLLLLLLDNLWCFLICTSFVILVISNWLVMIFAAIIEMKSLHWIIDS